MDIVAKPVETDEELRLAHDLMAKVHFSDYFAGMHWLDAYGESYPGFRREHTRVALCEGQLAGALRIYTETIRIGEARLKTGGFAAVTTAPGFRNRGICRRLMLDAMAYMKRHGYHISMLFGIPNFYHRFEFATTLADYAILVEVVEAAMPQTTCKARPAKPGDIRDIQKIHNMNDQGVACSLLRSAAHLTNKWERCKNMQVLLNTQGKVVAYFTPRRDKEQLTVDEVGVADEVACEAVLAAAAKVAGEESVGRIRFHVPPPHPFARFLLRYKSRHETYILRDAGGMMAFIDIGESLEHMIPEWESLLAQAAARDYRAEFTLLVNKAQFRVRANRGAIDVAGQSGNNKVSLSPGELMHLLTGYRYAEDILATRRRILTPEARALIMALFPKRTPFVWNFDKF